MKDETDLLLLTANLKRDDIKHQIWLDEPSRTVTCVALKPYRPATVPDYVKELKLFE